AYGVGRACAGCDDVIGPDEVEYEAHSGEGLSYHLHLRCAALWNTQVRRSAEATIGDARTIRDRSQAAQEQARLTSKHSGFARSSKATPSYGYLRMFQAQRSQSGADTRVFSSVEDAHRWLGLEWAPRDDVVDS